MTPAPLFISRSFTSSYVSHAKDSQLLSEILVILLAFQIKHTYTTMNYSQMTASAPVVLVEFFATWCPHCKHMAPIVQQVSELLDTRAKVVQLDIDKNSETAEEVGVKSIPAFIVYADGEERWRHNGEIEGEALLAAVESALS